MRLPSRLQSHCGLVLLDGDRGVHRGRRLRISHRDHGGHEYVNQSFSVPISYGWWRPNGQDVAHTTRSATRQRAESQAHQQISDDWRRVGMGSGIAGAATRPAYLRVNSASHPAENAPVGRILGGMNDTVTAGRRLVKLLD